MGGIVGVVLGAGESSRLGRPKQLLGFGDTTLLGHVVRDVEAAGELDRVVVVVPGGPPDIAEATAPARAEVVARSEPSDVDDIAGRGCASSLIAGLEAAGDCDAIVLLLGDMPGVTAAVIDEVVRAWRATSPWAAVTRYRDGIGHPFVFSAAAFDALRGLHGDKAVWKIVDREPPERVARIPVDHAMPADVDTWDDYVTICAAFGVAPDARSAEQSAEVYPRQ